MTPNSYIKIALDGPSGAGKSSLARAIAEKMNLVYVDTGALYRTIGLYVRRKNIDPKDVAAVVALLPEITLSLTFSDGKQHVLLCGEEVGDAIRTPEISMYASHVSAIPAVREFLLNTQREIAATASVIMDGRDIGTVIFPDADVKIFLTASDEARAQRRYLEFCAKGIDTTPEAVLADIRKRDENDSTRAVAPAIPATDAVILDNSAMDPEQTLTAAVEIIEEKLKQKNKQHIKRKKRHPQKGSRMYRFFKICLARLVRFFLRIHAVGQENIPETGGAVLCSNHLAVRDVFVIAAPIDRQPCFLAKKELFRIPVLSPLIRSLGAIPLDRGGYDVDAVKKSISLAKSGEIVTVFPQGTRRPGVNPADTPTKNGAAMIAAHAGVPMIPVCIKVKNEKYAFLRRIDLIIGKPLSLQELGLENGNREAYSAATAKVFGEICRLGGYEKSLPADEDTGHAALPKE